jgi:hypothetical protein
MRIKKLAKEWWGADHKEIYGYGDTVETAVGDCLKEVFRQEAEYVKELFKNPYMSAVGNIPFGYDSE